MQLYLGYNFIRNLEVVSMLNMLSQSHELYYHSLINYTEKYNPKIYLGSTIQTIAIAWIGDEKSTPSGVGQQTQKQVAKCVKMKKRDNHALYFY